GGKAPRKWDAGFDAIMPIVPVQIRQAVAKIPKRQKETDVTPVENTENDKCADKQCELGHAPKRFVRILAFQLFKNGLGIFTEKTQERIFEWTLRFALVTVFVNGNPIDGLPVLVGTVSVTFVMLHVNAFVENLAEADGD